MVWIRNIIQNITHTWISKLATQIKFITASTLFSDDLNRQRRCARVHSMQFFLSLFCIVDWRDKIKRADCGGWGFLHARCCRLCRHSSHLRFSLFTIVQRSRVNQNAFRLLLSITLQDYVRMHNWYAVLCCDTASGKINWQYSDQQSMTD